MADEKKSLIEAALALLAGRTDEAEYIDPKAREMIENSQRLIEAVGTEDHRMQAARDLLEALVPNYIDQSLWMSVALGENVHLPASDIYGTIEARLKGDDRGRVTPSNKMHNKTEAPSQFLTRQGKAITAAVKDISRLEDELESAKRRHTTLEAGTKAFASVCLANAVRQAAAPVFAMGPAWTILRAIRGATGVEVSPQDQRVQTHRILVTLHALVRDEPFEQEIKRAILAVCDRYSTKAKERNRSGTFTGPYDYEDILNGLNWPEDPSTRRYSGEDPDF